MLKTETPGVHLPTTSSSRFGLFIKVGGFRCAAPAVHRLFPMSCWHMWRLLHSALVSLSANDQSMHPFDSLTPLLLIDGCFQSAPPSSPLTWLVPPAILQVFLSKVMINHGHVFKSVAYCGNYRLVGHTFEVNHLGRSQL